MSKIISIIYCDYCNYKLILRDIDNCKLVEVPSEDRKKFKCPNCGRLIYLKKIKDVQKELEYKFKKEKYIEEYKNWIEQEFKNE